MPKQTLSLVPDAPIEGIDQSKFYQTPNWMATKAIQHKLTGADWTVWAFVQMLDPHGDRLKDIPNPQEIGELVGLSSKQVKRSLAKLEELGLYEIEIVKMRGRSLAGKAVKEMRTKLSDADKVVESRTKLSNRGQSCPEKDKSVQSKTTLSKPSPESLSEQGFEIPHTLNTLTDLLNTLSDYTRESFEKFCFKKIEESSFKIASPKSWLKKHYLEYWEEFSRKHPEAAGVEKSSATAQPVEFMTAEHLRQMYGADWKAAAAHFGINYEEEI